MNRYFDNKLMDLRSPSSLKREGAYSFFLEIFQEEKVNKEIRINLLRKLLREDFLFFGIGKIKSDSSVGRSFSLLLINLIIATDTTFTLKLNFLHPYLVRFLKEELDFRAMEERLGYIHIFPHFSDLLMTLNWHEGFCDENLLQLVELFCLKFSGSLKTYFSLEDCSRIQEALSSIRV